MAWIPFYLLGSKTIEVEVESMVKSIIHTCERIFTDARIFITLFTLYKLT